MILAHVLIICSIKASKLKNLLYCNVIFIVAYFYWLWSHLIFTTEITHSNWSHYSWKILVSGLGDGRIRSKYKVTLNEQSYQNPKISINVNAFIFRSVNSLFSARNLVISTWPEIKELPLANRFMDYQWK